MKRYLVWSVVAVIAACSWGAAAGDSVTLIDDSGESVHVHRPVERLASVYGAGTYYVYALGAGERLVAGWFIGVKGVAQAPDALLRLEPRLAQILAFGEPNTEELVARGVQLVLADGSRHGAFAEQMSDVGVPVLQYLVETPEALRDAMLLTARALGDEARSRAMQFAYDYTRIFGTLRENVEGVPTEQRARVLFLGTDKQTVASGEMFQSRLIAAAGGISVSEDLSGYWNEVNLEQILLWDPDVIILPPYGLVQPADLYADEDWASVRAVRTAQVYRMPRIIAPMDTPVPESLLGVLWIADVLYPGQVPLDLEKEAERFYRTYYSLELSEAELASLAQR